MKIEILENGARQLIADEGKLLTFEQSFSKSVIVPFGMPDWEEITDEGQMNVVINPEI